MSPGAVVAVKVAPPLFCFGPPSFPLLFSLALALFSCYILTRSARNGSLDTSMGVPLHKICLINEYQRCEKPSGLQIFVVPCMRLLVAAPECCFIFAVCRFITPVHVNAAPVLWGANRLFHYVFYVLLCVKCVVPFLTITTFYKITMYKNQIYNLIMLIVTRSTYLSCTSPMICLVLSGSYLGSGPVAASWLDTSLLSGPQLRGRPSPPSRSLAGSAFDARPFFWAGNALIHSGEPP